MSIEPTVNKRVRHVSLFKIAACWLLATGTSLADNLPDFNRDILPLLSDRSFQCHGPDEAAREGDFRLDLREDAHSRLGASAQDSTLMDRITSTDPEERMPPPQAGPGLTVGETRMLANWIDSGAVYEQHWSFQTPMASLSLQSERASDTHGMARDD